MIQHRWDDMRDEYTVKFDEKVLVNLINDDELKNLFRYNDNFA